MLASCWRAFGIKISASSPRTCRATSIHIWSQALNADAPYGLARTTRGWRASHPRLFALHAARLRELDDDQPCSPLNGSRLSGLGHGETSEAHLKGGPQSCGGPASSDARWVRAPMARGTCTPAGARSAQTRSLRHAVESATTARAPHAQADCEHCDQHRCRQTLATPASTFLRKKSSIASTRQRQHRLGL
ncbi:hypothetical protein FA09DRAFT_16722 [Tilletiopsis washingtonensis]|jgi:hypothetical protein|uniref:Uncharacterized protein n=1 Tax=Tilletiopsis washingtonensis TaxID=58919 RepID=A0A316ZAZ3_9BASI|nr:hypothetical protein FA09DRAFT_16722 [Tilletiopsis washingtonensis]PWN98092.1 hypothetical protein FA09DRAFT_16722 [Tilletiopsis washingtonensis]